jgi:hypothetical protein
VDIYDVINRARRLQRAPAHGVDPLVRLTHRHQLLRLQVADVIRLMRYADALGEVPQVTQQWAQLLEDALDHDEP